MLRSLRPSKKHASSVLGLAPEGFRAVWTRQFVSHLGRFCNDNELRWKEILFYTHWFRRIDFLESEAGSLHGPNILRLMYSA